MASSVAYGHCRIQELGDLVRHPSIMVELASADQIIVLRTGGAFHDARVCRLCRAFSGVSDPLPMFGRGRHDKPLVSSGESLAIWAVLCVRQCTMVECGFVVARVQLKILYVVIHDLTVSCTCSYSHVRKA